jgi:hypothetical protein
MIAMSSSWRWAAATLVADLRRIFADRLHSVVAYGPRVEGAEEAPLTCLALVESFELVDLEACARKSRDWSRQGIDTPLILPQREFQRSLDAFPIEYGEIMRAHERVFGSDPFEGVSVPGEDLRRACETQIKSHLVHLREGFIEAGGRPKAIADLVSASAPAFGALLRNVARLAGSTATERMEAARDGARAARVPEGIVGDVLSLERPAAIPATDAARLFPDYLAAVEQLARDVDSWRA